MPRSRWTFAATPVAVHTVRKGMCAAVQGWGVVLDDEQRSALQLVASELLTNGLLHAGGELTAEVALEHPYLILEVTDGDPRPPHRADSDQCAEQGRGLALLDALCLLRGYEPAGTGKRCFAVLSLEHRLLGPTPEIPEEGHVPQERADRWTLTPAAHRLLRRLLPADPQAPEEVDALSGWRRP
ncbi:ATP-binding protein [Streptomyces sp. NPDC015220]|uniref:ATP-binding protein n=1 Tax=Streptomyces sp. NPDC015220 TaxID=3364947 RepID=UPI0036F4B792